MEKNWLSFYNGKQNNILLLDTKGNIILRGKIIGKDKELGEIISKQCGCWTTIGSIVDKMKEEKES